MSYEPPEDFLRQISKILLANSRLQTYAANEQARFRSQYGASHEHVEALLLRGFRRQVQDVSGSTEMVIGETCRQHEETRGLQLQQASEIRDILQEILQGQRDLKVLISVLGQSIVPRLPKGYGPAGSYRLVPGEEFVDPEQDLDDEA